MTTYIDFIPDPTGPVNFTVTLDGTQYRAEVRWNLYGQRYYVNVYGLSGGLLFSVPLIGSLIGFDIERTSWDNGRTTVTLVRRDTWADELTGSFTFKGFKPDAYNGVFECLTLSRNTLSYPMALDPGPPSVLGHAFYDIDMAAGYVAVSTLVFREANQQFEVTP